MTSAELGAALKNLDRKVLVDIGIRYAVLLVFLSVFFTPSLGRMQGLKSEINELSARLQMIRGRISEALSLEKERDQIVGKIQAMEGRFFDEGAQSELLSLVSELCKKHSLQMTASKPIQKKELPEMGEPGAPANQAVTRQDPRGDSAGAMPPPVEFYTSHEFEVELVGGYHTLGSFLTALYRLSRFVQVKELRIAGGTDSPGTHTISLVLAVYSRAPTKSGNRSKQGRTAR